MEKHEIVIPGLDNIPRIEELELALKEIGTGVSINGIPPSVVKILPASLKETIYPEKWSKQILHSIKKDRHTPSDPKLRGIAITPFLCRSDHLVPLMFPAETLQAMRYLADQKLRQEAGLLSSNNYIFASLQKSEGHTSR